MFVFTVLGVLTTLIVSVNACWELWTRVIEPLFPRLYLRRMQADVASLREALADDSLDPYERAAVISVVSELDSKIAQLEATP